MSLDINEQYEKIYKYCFFKINDSFVAEDLTQETFLKYFSGNSYIDRGKPLAYLYVIAKNLCIDYYKSQKIDLITDDIQAADQFIETSYSLLQTIKTLPKEQQELILLRYANELQVGEISKITNQSRFAVYRKINTALKSLKQILREEDFL